MCLGYPAGMSSYPYGASAPPQYQYAANTSAATPYYNYSQQQVWCSVEIVEGTERRQRRRTRARKEAAREQKEVVLRVGERKEREGRYRRHY